MILKYVSIFECFCVSVCLFLIINFIVFYNLVVGNLNVEYIVGVE